MEYAGARHSYPTVGELTHEQPTDGAHRLLGAGSDRALHRRAAASLRAGAEERDWSLGIDSTGLVQEFAPAEENRIVRVEVLGFDAEWLEREASRS